MTDESKTSDNVPAQVPCRRNMVMEGHICKMRILRVASVVIRMMEMRLTWR